MLLRRLPNYFCAILAGLVLMTCGKKAAPRPPVPILPVPAGQVQLQQAGNRFLYSFQLPVISTDQKTPVEVTKVEIFRMKVARTPVAEPGASPQQAASSEEKSSTTDESTESNVKPEGSTEEGSSAATAQEASPPPASVPPAESTPTTTAPPPASPAGNAPTPASQPATPAVEQPRTVDVRDFERNADKLVEISQEEIGGYLRESTMIYSDPISLDKDSTDREHWFFYGAKVYNQKGKASAFPKFLALYPDAVPEAPAQFTAMISEKKIDMKWSAVTRDSAGNELPPENVVYFVYRGGSANFAPVQPLNSQPLSETQYSDSTFRFGQTYYYFVRAAKKDQRQTSQSGESNAILVYPQDVFAPSAPQELNVVAAREGMVLIWAPNPEDDVAGYNVYRSTKSGQGYEKVNQQLVRETTYTDTSVDSGKTYYYVLTAVDSALKPNESEYSKEVFETKRNP